MGLTLYIYALSFLWLPLFYGLIYFVYFKKLKKNIIFYLSCFLLVLVGLPIILFYLKNQFGFIDINHLGPFALPELFTTRFDMVSVFKYPAPQAFFMWLIAYLSHFSPIYFLFDVTLSIFPRYIGLIYIFELPFVLAGFLLLWRRRKLDEYKLLLGWFLLFPLPASLTIENIPHPLRTVNALPLVVLVSALGFAWLWEKLKEHKAFLRKYLIFVFINIAIFFLIFIFSYPVTSHQAFMTDTEEAVSYVKEVYQDYDIFHFPLPRYINDINYVNLLHAFRYQPEFFQNEAAWLENGVSISHFDKFYFGEIDESILKKSPKILHIIREEKASGNIVKEIFYPNDQVSFRLISEEKF